MYMHVQFMYMHTLCRPKFTACLKPSTFSMTQDPSNNTCRKEMPGLNNVSRISCVIFAGTVAFTGSLCRGSSFECDLMASTRDQKTGSGIPATLRREAGGAWRAARRGSAPSTPVLCLRVCLLCFLLCALCVSCFCCLARPVRRTTSPARDVSRTPESRRATRSAGSSASHQCRGGGPLRPSVVSCRGLAVEMPTRTRSEVEELESIRQLYLPNVQVFGPDRWASEHYSPGLHAEALMGGSCANQGEEGRKQRRGRRTLPLRLPPSRSLPQWSDVARRLYRQLDRRNLESEQSSQKREDATWHCVSGVARDVSQTRRRETQRPTYKLG